MRRALATAAAALATAAAAAFPAAGASAQAPVPVTIGTSGPDLDACHSLGAVVGLDPAGDNFLAVRSGPGTEFAKVDEVHTGDALWLCEKRGSWWGVVYAAGAGSADCDVASPVPSPAPYGGSCRSGWVSDRYVEMTAG